MSLKQFNPPHPGELIKRTYIEPFKEMSANKIADELGVAHSTFNRLINGNAAISPEMALRLSKVLGSSPESWLTLQESYDLWKARECLDVSELERIDFNKVA